MKRKEISEYSFLFAYLYLSRCQISDKTVIKLDTPVYTPLPSPTNAGLDLSRENLLRLGSRISYGRCNPSNLNDTLLSESV